MVAIYLSNYCSLANSSPPPPPSIIYEIVCDLFLPSPVVSTDAEIFTCNLIICSPELKHNNNLWLKPMISIQIFSLSATLSLIRSHCHSRTRCSLID